jgi:hypothetical protein
MLSEVVLGQIGVPKPIVAVLAPVVKANEFNGHVAGVLSLNEIEQFLEKNAQSKTMLYTLLDTTGNVILTNHKDQQVMQPFARSNGSLHRLDDTISQWAPKLPPNTPSSERWKASSYLVDSPIGGLSEWRLILEQPVAPFQKMLYARYTSVLALLFILLFTCIRPANPSTPNEQLQAPSCPRKPSCTPCLKRFPIRAPVSPARAGSTARNSRLN